MLLRLQPASQIIGGEEIEGYGIFLQGVIIRHVLPENYIKAHDQVIRANDILNEKVIDPSIIKKIQGVQ